MEKRKDGGRKKDNNWKKRKEMEESITDLKGALEDWRDIIEELRSLNNTYSKPKKKSRKEVR